MERELRRKIGRARAAESTIIRVERGERNIRNDLDFAMECVNERTEVGLAVGSIMYELAMAGKA